MVCIATCVMIYLCSTVQQLSAMFTGISLMIGMGIHLLRALSLKIAADHLYKNGFTLLFWVMPFTALMTLMAALPTEHKVMLILQTIGFTAIGLFILSTFPNRKFEQS
jgi:hypothetical protein